MNCPRCNAFIQPGATFCTNCNLQFQPQAGHQPQQTFYAPPVVPGAAAESNKEKLYRKLLVGLALFLVGHTLFWALVNKLEYEWEWNIRWLSSSARFLFNIVFASIPLLVGLILPKANGVRVLMIILGGTWFLYRFGLLIYETFFYSPEPFIYFNF